MPATEAQLTQHQIYQRIPGRGEMGVHGDGTIMPKGAKLQKCKDQGQHGKCAKRDLIGITPLGLSVLAETALDVRIVESETK